MKKIDYWKLTTSLLLCQFAGVIGSFFTISSVSTWYMALNKPAFNPPKDIFSPVWIMLYLLMGISLYLIWNKGIRSKQSKTAVSIFGIQLALNTFWPILFFGLRLPLSAFIEIIILWIAILLTMIHFYKISKTASYLLIPYFLWVSFATVLNFFLFYLN
ncbi:MAG: tryptophan-rich sensory protein [Nanoarchaeota archaeon]|nr:tryptophan-rich sensory protein [Nanoarchaeota archaeon]MBU1643624.1 tryptophan-rich sensory protein [Nanoarchaeota archaeon]MBU1976794.1 tryptophan-rich sensory protein [Nanoarchaeota archaeon]